MPAKSESSFWIAILCGFRYLPCHQHKHKIGLLAFLHKLSHRHIKWRLLLNYIVNPYGLIRCFSLGSFKISTMLCEAMFMLLPLSMIRMYTSFLHRNWNMLVVQPFFYFFSAIRIRQTTMQSGPTSTVRGKISSWVGTIDSLSTSSSYTIIILTFAIIEVLRGTCCNIIPLATSLVAL